MSISDAPAPTTSAEWSLSNERNCLSIPRQISRYSTRMFNSGNHAQQDKTMHHNPDVRAPKESSNTTLAWLPRLSSLAQHPRISIWCASPPCATSTVRDHLRARFIDGYGTLIPFWSRDETTKRDISAIPAGTSDITTPYQENATHTTESDAKCVPALYENHIGATELFECSAFS